MVELSDAGLIAASLADPDRFGAIFDRHMPEIRRYLHRRVGDTEGDDLTSDTFAIAFKGREKYDLDRHDARPWLYGIAANVIRNHKRSEKRQARAYAKVAPDPGVEIDLPGVHDRLDAGSRRTELFAALASLRSQDRELMLLHAWADLTHSEIAEALDLPIGTVKSRLSRAQKKVHGALGLPAPATGDGTGEVGITQTGGNG